MAIIEIKDTDVPEIFGACLLVHVRGYFDKIVYIREKKGRPGYYYETGDLSLVSGHSDGGEFPHVTAKRELEEEAGLLMDSNCMRWLGGYRFILEDSTLAHLTVYEGFISEYEWLNRHHDVELLSVDEVIRWKHANPHQLRITTIAPSLLLKYGETADIKRLLRENPMPGPWKLDRIVPTSINISR